VGLVHVGGREAAGDEKLDFSGGEWMVGLVGDGGEGLIQKSNFWVGARGPEGIATS